MTDTTATKAAPKRGRGRPPGSPNKAKPRASVPVAPAAPDGPTSGDDKAAQSIADKIAAAATPPPITPEGGRPTVRQAAMSALAEQLATTYRGAGALVSVGGAGLQLAARTRSIGVRVQAVGDELQRNADSCGLALARFADSHPAVKQWLTKASTGATLMLVIAAHAPILFAAFGAPPEMGDMAAQVIADPENAIANLLGGLDVEAMVATFAQAFTGGQPGTFTEPVVDTTATG